MARIPKNVRNNQFLTLTYPEFDFGVDITFTGYFRLPSGFTADLVKIGLMVTEAFACTTTAADIRLGTSSDDDAYASKLLMERRLLTFRMKPMIPMQSLRSGFPRISY